MSSGARLNGKAAYSRVGFIVGAVPTISLLCVGGWLVGGGSQRIVVRALGGLPGRGGDVPDLDVVLSCLDHDSAVSGRPAPSIDRG